MKLISHRGNINGRNPNKENSPQYIDAAIAAGFDVEVDVWKVWNSTEKKWDIETDCPIYALGHDTPTYVVDEDFLITREKKLWCHAKSIETLSYLMDLGVHCFWHQEDDVTLTSKGWVWTYPGKELTHPKLAAAIAVVPERSPGWDIKNAAGICSDFIANYLDTSVK